MRLLLLLLIVLAALMAVSSSAPPRVSILRATSVAFDDEAISVVIQVEPNDLNRSFIVAALDGDLQVRSSMVQLDGSAAKKTHWMTWERLPAGELLLVVVLLDQQGPVARVTRPIHVVARLSP